jgi:dsRNA-specific ribonuclease
MDLDIIKKTQQQKKSWKKNFILDNKEEIKIHDPIISDIKGFKNFLKNILINRGNVEEYLIDDLFDYNGLSQIISAFTHSSLTVLNPNNTDYEFFENLGDLTVNKCIIWYTHRRFPNLKTDPNGVQIMAEYKKQAIDKQTFRYYSEELGFSQWIRYAAIPYKEKDNIKYITLDSSMKEDVFECFFASLEDLIDGKILINTGYSICYNIISSLLDEKDINLNLESLKDPKTKLQEIFQKLKQPFPKYVFPDKGPYKGYVQFDLYNVDTKKIPKFLDWIKFTNENLKTTFQIYSDDNIQIKKIAEKSAAEKALQFLDKTYNITWSSKI